MGRTWLLCSILVVHSTVCLAQIKTIAERLGYPADSKLLIILADDVGVYHSANVAAFTALAISSSMVPTP